jgi:hypothetical protein
MSTSNSSDFLLSNVEKINLIYEYETRDTTKIIIKAEISEIISKIIYIKYLTASKTDMKLNILNHNNRNRSGLMKDKSFYGF